MKKVMSLLFCIVVVFCPLFGGASQTSQAVSIDELDLLIKADPDWIVMDKDTTEDDLIGKQLFGVSITAPVAESLVETFVSYDAVVTIAATDEAENTFFVTIHSFEDSDFQADWELTPEMLTNNVLKQFSPDAAMYQSGSDVYIKMPSQNEDVENSVYITILNGKAISFLVESVEPTLTEEELESFTTSFFERVVLDKKPNPSTSEKEPSFFLRVLNLLFSRVKEYFILVVIFVVGGAAIKFIGKLFRKGE